MAITFVQEVTNVSATGTPLTASLVFTGLTTGNSLFVVMAQITSQTRTYSISDNLGGTWIKAVSQENFTIVDTIRTIIVWYRENVASGNLTVSVTHGLGSGNFIAGGIEIDFDNTDIQLAASDNKYDSTAQSNHTCSASGITSANPCIAVCVGLLRAASTECNSGAGYTEFSTSFANANLLFQYQIFSSGCTSETGAWSHTGTTRASLGIIGLFSGVVGGTVIPVFDHHYRQQESH